MQKASEFLNKEELAAIKDAVVRAEGKTSVEIVPVVASVSGRYDRAEDMVGLWLGGTLMVVLWLLWPVTPAELGDWDAAFPLNYFGWLAALVVGFVLGAILAARSGWLRRLFTPRREMVEEVERRAREAFFDQRIHHTEGATGVIIYVSLYERLVTVLADDAVQKVLPDGEVKRLCDELTGKLGRAPADGLKETIASLGDSLAEPLPRADDDVDELENAVVLID
jgi:putative membrane protein